MERITKERITNTRLYLGPMSKNVVDAIIQWNNEYDDSVGIIASRRQIDYFGGYSNNWTTQNFVKYVKNKNIKIIICRDHAGVNQGSFNDDGIASLLVDSVYMNLIHIDPFKAYNFDDSIKYTVNAIKRCGEFKYNNCFFEIGTEEAIFSMSSNDLDYFITEVKQKISDELYSKIIYAVIQSGTSLKSGTNTGTYNQDRLLAMNAVCQKHGLLSKEHNGDYLTPEIIKNKFELGLSAINIAPEVAHIETNIVLQSLSTTQINKWFELCIKNGSWKKWFPKEYNPNDNVFNILKLCGHYVFSNPEFIEIFNLNLISKHVEKEVHNFIKERLL